jgi:sigma-B regulation protein RsbU (phosphoserine phosphatase)
MLTAIVKSAFQTSHVDGFEPLSVVQRISAGLAAFSPERFVTLIAALISPEEGCLRYVNAGHPPAALWGDGRKPVWLESTGPLVSAVLPGTWEAHVVPMSRGDHLLLYTDGISEVLAGEDGGGAEERFAYAIRQVPEGGSALLEMILADVQRMIAGEFQQDDLTLLTARVVGPAGG